MTTQVGIETGRFRLRELTEEDATLRYLGWLANPEAKRFIVAAKTTHELERLAEYVRQRMNRPDILFLGIFEKRSGLHIGNIKYEPVDSISGFAVMGILIGDPGWRGMGVAGEAIQGSAQWLREHRGITQIILGVSDENHAAIKAYEKIGFVTGQTAYLPPPKRGFHTMIWSSQ